MEYVHAALILHKAGKEINEENIKKIIEAAGITADEAKIKTLVTSLKEVNIDEVLKEGISIAAAPASEGKAEEKKEEQKEEKKEEAATEGLAALFG